MACPCGKTWGGAGRAELSKYQKQSGGQAGQYADLTTGEGSLAGDPRWQESKFGSLERFMIDFLAGGAGGSESMRLKLQTPLFVASALLDAARKQLEADLSLAQQVCNRFFGIGVL